MVAEEKWEEATEIARRQVRNGAHIVDVCLQSTDREEINDIPPFYEKLIRKIKAPVMIDTTDPKAVELALTYCQGKSIINSVNLEDGEEKFERICPLAQAYGAALVVGTIDEDKVQAQAFTRERKLAVAQRSVETCSPSKYGIPRRGHHHRPAGLPLRHRRRELHRRRGGDHRSDPPDQGTAFPYVKTVLGVSNICFGLPAAAREVVNSVFLYYAPRPGSTSPSSTPRSWSASPPFPVEERRLAEHSAVQHAAGRSCRATILNRSAAQTAPRTGASRPRGEERRHQPVPHRRHRRALPRRAARGQGPKAEDLPLDQRLANYIIEGTKDGLIADLDLQARRRRRAARHHQRSADGRHDRSRPPVQQQRTDRGRSAAIGRSDEGRGEPPRTVHGEGRHGGARQDRCSPRSRATSTTSARTWSRSSSSTTATT